MNENQLFTLFEGDGSPAQDKGPTLQFDVATGRNLADARQRLKMSVDDVANALHLSVEFVRNIEERNYHTLPSPAYATGYVRAYANLVHLNADELIKMDPDLGLPAINKRHTVNTDHATITRARVTESNAPNRWSWVATTVKIFTILVFLGVALCGWIYRAEIGEWWTERVPKENFNQFEENNDSQSLDLLDDPNRLSFEKHRY